MLQEKEAALRRLAQTQQTVNPHNAQSAKDLLREAEAIADLCRAVRRLIDDAPGIDGLS